MTMAKVRAKVAARKVQSICKRKCESRTDKAVKATEQYGRQLQKAIAYHEPVARKREEKRYREHMKVRNPLGQQINARQKMRVVSAR